jgi:ABC-2 type transport system permease protein
MGLAILSSSIAFVGIMMFISVLGKTEHSAAGMTWAVLLIMSMVGGGMLPLFFMPSWLQKLSHISPMKWSILAMEGAIWRHFSFLEVARPCLILLAVGVIFFAIGVRSFRWSEQ